MVHFASLTWGFASQTETLPHFAMLVSMDKWQPCYDKADTQELLNDLQLAHSSPAHSTEGRPTTLEELEKMQMGAALLFAEWPTAQQVDFLSCLSASEATRMLELSDVELRKFLVSLLPSDQRDALEACWDERNGVPLSA